MRKVILVALNALTRLSRDRKGLILLIGMPLLLIAILGTALNGMMQPSTLDPFSVLMVNADQPAKPALPPGAPPEAAAALQPVNLGKVLVDEVFGNDQVEQIVKLTLATDLEAARAQVAEGKAVAVVYVPPTFSADVLAGKQTAVQLLTDPGQATQAAIVEQIAMAFTDQVTADSLATRLLSGEQARDLTAEAARRALPQVANTQTGARNVKAVQYYSAAMAVMYMVMTAFARAKQILQDRDDGTLSRILISPTARPAVVAGQILGNVVVLVAQFLVLMAGTRLFFGVDWGSWPAALSLGAATAVAAAGIATAAAGLLDDPKAADAATGTVALVMAALSGAMFPLYGFPEWMRLIAKFIPNYWALQGFLDQMAGLGAAYLWTPLAVLLSIGLITGSLGAWRLATR